MPPSTWITEELKSEANCKLKIEEVEKWKSERRKSEYWRSEEVVRRAKEEMENRERDTGGERGKEIEMGDRTEQRAGIEWMA